MAASSDNWRPLPDVGQLREAVGIFLAHAYPQGPPAAAERFMPTEDADPRRWLMGELVERKEPDAPLERVRSFSLRIGNSLYPHMKLRLTRVGDPGACVMTVDSHDAMLHAPPESDDFAELESLKRHNAAVALAIVEAMDAAGLPTDRSFLRERIRHAKRSRPNSPPCG